MSCYFDLEKYKKVARQAGSEGCVLLKNDREALPFRKNDNVAVFGRIANHYYKSGLGSGGLVNIRYVTGILSSLEEEKDVAIHQGLKAIYEKWESENPYENGEGWGQVPWSQQEMPLTQEILDTAKDADIALVVLGRTAGEDQDNVAEKGSYYLTDTEKNMLSEVRRTFDRMAVVLNVSNIIDMEWVQEIDPDAVLYVWQGGQEGGNSVADVLTGRVNPSGKLTDTLARNLSDYPSDRNFGSNTENYYEEDIYVGYRYFETFNRENVLYPFGYGLSYTDFETICQNLVYSNQELKVSLSVTNTGKTAGKEVVGVYISCPNGKLGKASKVLVGFKKTGLLAPGETEYIALNIPAYTFASYDDLGVTGHKSCYVLEEGIYTVYAGINVSTAVNAGSFHENFRILEQLQETCSPHKSFNRLKSGANGPETETVPVRTPMLTQERMSSAKALLPDCSYTGDLGYKLADVYSKKISMETFISQIPTESLIHMTRGEGMSSPKVTYGAGGAFGGVTEELQKFGIPAACCTDGPSGIRLDIGTKAFSIPNGTALGCSFNTDLVEELYEMLGAEMRMLRIDVLLGPGMNIHRHPLNGRNFEYISEDPLVTGKMAAAMVRGMQKAGNTGTIKHFCANNQEKDRRFVQSILSERALREIYLKGFEIAVREGNAKALMTSYNPVNGIWMAGSYDLCVTILRNEWGFDGIIMSDWWAESNYEGEKSNRKCHAPMIHAQNDLFMVVQDARDMSSDDIAEKVQSGEITRGELAACAKNILNFIMTTVTMQYEMDLISEEEKEARKTLQETDENPVVVENVTSCAEGVIEIDCSSYETGKGKSYTFALDVKDFGFYNIIVTAQSDLGELAQLPVNIFFDNVPKPPFAFRGSNGAMIEEKKDFGPIFGNNHFLKFSYGADGIQVLKIRFEAWKVIDLFAEDNFEMDQKEE